MVVTTVNPKIFGGNLYLNSTPATKFYFDTTLQAIGEFTASLGGPIGASFPRMDTKDGIKKKELVSIGELNKFISNSDEQTQEADFLCKARIIEVLEQNGWSFVSCTACSRKVDKSGTTLYCNRCATSNVTGVIKYRVELSVDDGDDSATFVVFDREMVKLTKRDAADLTLDELNVGDREGLPECLSDLAGKEYIFHIRVTPYNFTPNHRTFTVAGISDDIPHETFNTKAAEVVYVEDGGSSRTDKTSVAKSDEPNPLGIAVKESGRKRPRE